jgi:hypothetical protein
MRFERDHLLVEDADDTDTSLPHSIEHDVPSNLEATQFRIDLFAEPTH